MKKLEDKIHTKEQKPDLTLKDVVDAIAEGYRIESVRMVSNYINESQLYGLHIDNGDQKEILINKEIPLEDRRETILHEFYHALFSKIGRKQSEREVEYLAKKKYKELYNERH